MTEFFRIERVVLTLTRRVGLILGCLSLFGCFAVSEPTLQEQLKAAELFHTGVSALRSGDLTVAENSFALMHELTPGAVSTDGLGCVEFARGNLELAGKRFREALEFDPSYSEAYGHLADMYAKLGKHDRALRLYRRARVDRPLNAQIRNNLAVQLFVGAQLLPPRSNPERARSEAVVELRKAALLSKNSVIQRNLERVQSQK